MRCPKCGKTIKKKDMYCGFCGLMLREPEVSMNDDKIKLEKEPLEYDSLNTSNKFHNDNNSPQRGRILLACLISLLVILLSAFIVKNYVFLSPAKIFDEDNIGEIYYFETEDEHISNLNKDLYYADNEVLIVAKDNTSYKDIEKIAKNYNSEIVGWIEQTGDYQVRFSSSLSFKEIEEICKSLEKEKQIEMAYPDYIFNVSADDKKGIGDFSYGNKWDNDLKNTSDNKGKSWGFEAIRTPGAWQVIDTIKKRITPVRVGLIDVGFDTTHKDLGYAEVFYNTNPADHGTHVSGTMAAKSNNKEGICGVYPYGDGNLYAVSYQGAQTYIENKPFHQSSMFLKIAFSELVLRNVKVINTSLAFNYYKPKNWNGQAIQYQSERWNDFIKYINSNEYILGDFLTRLINKGYDFVVVSSAGNDSHRSSDNESLREYDSKYSSWINAISKDKYEEVFDRIIVVGAVDSDFNISDFSNGRDRVDVYAPGEKIFSTVQNNKYQNVYKDNEGKKHTWSGTSMAAPHVSGVAAMVWTVNSRLNGKEVKEILCKSSNRSSKCTSCNMIDAFYCVAEAAVKNKDNEINKPNNGALLGWVVESGNEGTAISKAFISVETDNGQDYEKLTTDSSGHFEMILPEGQYRLHVSKDGYEDFSYPKLINVKDGEVEYIDWIKMQKISSRIGTSKTNNSVEDQSSSGQIQKQAEPYTPSEKTESKLIEPFLGGGWKCHTMAPDLSGNSDNFVPLFTATVYKDYIEKQFADGNVTVLEIYSVEEDATGDGVIIKLENGAAFHAPTKDSDTLWLFGDWKCSGDKMYGADSMSRDSKESNVKDRDYEDDTSDNNIKEQSTEALTGVHGNAESVPGDSIDNMLPLVNAQVNFFRNKNGTVKHVTTCKNEHDFWNTLGAYCNSNPFPENYAGDIYSQDGAVVITRSGLIEIAYALFEDFDGIIPNTDFYEYGPISYDEDEDTYHFYPASMHDYIYKEKSEPILNDDGIITITYLYEESFWPERDAPETFAYDIAFRVNDHVNEEANTPYYYTIVSVMELSEWDVLFFDENDNDDVDTIEATDCFYMTAADAAEYLGLTDVYEMEESTVYKKPGSDIDDWESTYLSCTLNP